MLFMMSDEQGSVPHKFMLLNYRPRDEVIMIVPLNPDTRVYTGGSVGRLTDVYRSGGSQLVMRALDETLGIDCEFFVKFDRASFTAFTGMHGDIPVNVPFPFSAGGLDLISGEHFLSGGDLFIYMSFVNFTESPEDFRLAVTGRAVTAFINSNLRHMDEDAISSSFNRILNNAATNLEFGHYIEYHAALHFTSTQSINPASFYVPEGERTAHEFVMSPQSIAHIQSRFNLTEVY
jgi:anionic cell wall polymer biosynthesis LytR-Cps2A-Psr (LCP) family protein